MHIMIHTSPRSLLTRTSPTLHFITLTNQVCQIGLSQSTYAPVSILWIRLEQSSPFLTESVGIQLSRVIWSTTLPTTSFIYSLSRSTYKRKIWNRKESKSLTLSPDDNFKSRQTQYSHKISMSKIFTLFFKSHHNKKKNRLTWIIAWNHDSAPKRFQPIHQ